MPVTSMNHFTILTDDLDTTLAFYAEHLRLKPGPRPPFTFPGAWLYAEGGNDPILHIVAVKEKGVLVKGVIDHMAFSGKDLAGAVAKLKSAPIPCRETGAGPLGLAPVVVTPDQKLTHPPPRS